MKKIVTPGVFLAFLLMSSVMVQAETPASSTGSLQTAGGQATPAVKSYDELLTAIRGTRAESRTRVEKAVEQERVREAWEIGKLIDTHVLQHKERADYDEQIILKLAEDLGTSRTELSYMLQFARAYPIFPAPEILSWAHYRELLSLNDSQEREAVASEAVKNKWSQKELREAVRKANGEKGSGPFLGKRGLTPLLLGKPGTYRIVKATVGPETGKVVIDLGFSNYYRTSKDLRFKEGAIIEATPPFAGSSPSDLIRLSKRTPEDLYTYRAWVVNVLDGDTVKAVVDLGFGVRSVQTLRLRGIDAPEIMTADGMVAKKALEKMLGIRGTRHTALAGKQVSGEPVPGTSILIKTVKSDKYDRYLADVFVDNRPQAEDRSPKSEDKSFATDKYLYVNQKLVDEGLAVLVEE